LAADVEVMHNGTVSIISSAAVEVATVALVITYCRAIVIGRERDQQ